MAKKAAERATFSANKLRRVLESMDVDWADFIKAFDADNSREGGTRIDVDEMDANEKKACKDFLADKITLAELTDALGFKSQASAQRWALEFAKKQLAG